MATGRWRAATTTLLSVCRKSFTADHDPRIVSRRPRNIRTTFAAGCMPRVGSPQGELLSPMVSLGASSGSPENVRFAGGFQTWPWGAGRYPPQGWTPPEGGTAAIGIRVLGFSAFRSPERCWRPTFLPRADRILRLLRAKQGVLAPRNSAPVTDRARRGSARPPALYEDSCTPRRARNGSGAPRLSPPRP